MSHVQHNYPDLIMDTVKNKISDSSIYNKRSIVPRKELEKLQESYIIQLHVQLSYWGQNSKFLAKIAVSRRSRIGNALFNLFIITGILKCFCFDTSHIDDQFN